MLCGGGQWASQKAQEALHEAHGMQPPLRTSAQGEVLCSRFTLSKRFCPLNSYVPKTVGVGIPVYLSPGQDPNPENLLLA